MRGRADLRSAVGARHQDRAVHLPRPGENADHLSGAGRGLPGQTRWWTWISEILPGMRGASFRSRKRLAVSSMRHSCSKNIEPQVNISTASNRVAVVTEAIPASGDRLQILSLDRRVEVDGYVLENFVTRTARCDIPAVAPDWQCERQEQRGDLRRYSSRCTCVSSSARPAREPSR